MNKIAQTPQLDQKAEAGHNLMMRSSSVNQLSSSMSQTKTDSFKVFNIESNLPQKRMTNPLTGEDFVIDKQDLLRNTQKCPFQNSVRDTTNYFLTH